MLLLIIMCLTFPNPLSKLTNIGKGRGFYPLAFPNHFDIIYKRGGYGLKNRRRQDSRTVARGFRQSLVQPFCMCQCNCKQISIVYARQINGFNEGNY